MNVTENLRAAGSLSNVRIILKNKRSHLWKGTCGTWVCVQHRLWLWKLLYWWNDLASGSACSGVETLPQARSDGVIEIGPACLWRRPSCKLEVRNRVVQTESSNTCHKYKYSVQWLFLVSPINVSSAYVVTSNFGLLSLEESYKTVTFGVYLLFCTISSCAFSFTFYSVFLHAHFSFRYKRSVNAMGFPFFTFLLGMFGYYFQSYSLNVLLF